MSTILRNRIVVSGSVSYVECINGRTHWVTASTLDLAFIQHHRWRVIDGQVCTTSASHEYERRIDYTNLLYGVPQEYRAHFRDRNCLNVSRENVSWFSGSANVYTIRGTTAYLHLPPVTVKFPAAKLGHVRLLRWRYDPTHTANGQGIRSVSSHLQARTTTLARHILDLPADKPRVVFRDGDQFNCTLRNLQILIPKRR